MSASDIFGSSYLNLMFSTNKKTMKNENIRWLHMLVFGILWYDMLKYRVGNMVFVVVICSIFK